MRPRLRPGRFVHINREVMFEGKQFKRSSQSHLTWPHPHTQLERDGSFPHWILLLLSVCRGDFSTCLLPAVAQHKKV